MVLLTKECCICQFWDIVWPFIFGLFSSVGFGLAAPAAEAEAQRRLMGCKFQRVDRRNKNVKFESPKAVKQIHESF